MTPGDDPGSVTSAEALGNLLLFHLSTKSAYQRMAVAHVVREWAHRQQVGSIIFVLRLHQINMLLVELSYPKLFTKLAAGETDKSDSKSDVPVYFLFSQYNTCLASIFVI